MSIYHMRKIFGYIILFLGAFHITSAQTCCSAGAPISSNIQIVNKTKNTLALQLGYEYKSINLLVDNNQRLTNDPRSRYGQNITLKADYTLHKNIAFSLLIPVVHQNRSTISENQRSIGIGDVTLIGQWTLLNKFNSSLNINGGVKLPTGKLSHRNESSIFLSPDMQSGSGSTDFIFGLTYVKNQWVYPNLNVLAYTSFKFNTTNGSFGGTPTFSGRSFKFGDEYIAGMIFSYNLVASFGLIVPDISLKYRHSTPNIEQMTSAPNSGGDWFSIPIGILVSPQPNKSVRLYTEVPVFQNLDGLQITTDITIGVQLNYSFSLSSETSNTIINF